MKRKKTQTFKEFKDFMNPSRRNESYRPSRRLMEKNELEELGVEDEEIQGNEYEIGNQETENDNYCKKQVSSMITDIKKKIDMIFYKFGLNGLEKLDVAIIDTCDRLLHPEKYSDEDDEIQGFEELSMYKPVVPQYNNGGMQKSSKKKKPTKPVEPEEDDEDEDLEQEVEINIASPTNESKNRRLQEARTIKKSKKKVIKPEQKNVETVKQKQNTEDKITEEWMNEASEILKYMPANPVKFVPNPIPQNINQVDMFNSNDVFNTQPMVQQPMAQPKPQVNPNANGARSVVTDDDMSLISQLC